MTTFDRSPRGSAHGGLPVAAGLVLALAIGLALLPGPTAGRLRSLQQTLLAPGQRAVADVVDWCQQRSAMFTADALTAEEVRGQRDELETLRRRNAQLQTALALATAQAQNAPRASTDSVAPLLVPKLLSARVLGRQARAFLAQMHTIAAGADDGVLPAALVLDDALPLVDQGTQAGVDAGHLVLSGATVWGQVAALGGHVSSVRRVNAPGYRDLVQLARASGEQLVPGPQGLLEGTGEPWCRIKLIQTTQPVSEGDLVLATGGEALLDAPLVYGRVIRLESRPGAPHWEIWMEPAARAHPRNVAVLQISLNAARLAAGNLPLSRLVQTAPEREQP